MAVVLLTGDKMDPNRLAQAQAAAPWEPWALNLRLRAVARFGPPSAEVEPAFAADLKRALMADWGQAVVADLYAANAGLRPAITRAAETASAAAQRAFLEKLRSREGGA